MSLPFYLLNRYMDIRELEDFKLSDAVKFHDELNPNLWKNDKLRPEVREQLLTIADDFLSELGISGLKVKDVTVSGSNAAYTYTPYSDLDLHILVDFKQLPNDEVYQELFTAKKSLYNDSHDIKVHGVPVELYVQDSNQPVVSIGEYSLKDDEWLKYPSKRRANFNQTSTRSKYEKLGSMIELALKSNNLKQVDKVLKIIKQYRKAGLDKTGEFGPENLAFKALRNTGLIKKLYNYKNNLHSRELSIEDYDPNGPPPGPEFPPTMPSGTIRVDVSDVYDWYKLGQHISNMKGLGKHDFGKGPPSTILSFGDEDLEHQYIQALKKTGLDTTDIDPKAHDTKKGQKVDPTYNVNESVKFIEGTNCKNCVWWKKDSEKPVGKDELNKYGGLKPPNKEYIAMSKRVDLVTLPGKDTVKEKGFCYHKDINDWVTERMCCAKWDGKGVIRDYKGESPLMEEELQVDENIEKVDGGWLHTGTGHRYNYDTKNYPIYPLPRYRTYVNQSMYDEGSYNDVIQYMQFLLNNYQTKNIKITGQEIADTLAKLGNKNSKQELENFNKKYNKTWKSWNDFFEAYKEYEEEKFQNAMTRIGSRHNLDVSEASGYIPSEKEKNDPRFKTALTIDVKPDSIKKNAKAFGFNVTRAGIPPPLRK